MGFMLLKSMKEEDLNNYNFKDNKAYNYLGDTHKAEIKYDGERIQAIKKDKEVILLNRRGNNKTPNYLEVVEELKKIKGNFVIDGEMISRQDDFKKLQRRALTQNPEKQKELRQDIPVRYMVFDILWNDFKDLRNEPLTKRKKELSNILGNFVFSEFIEMVIPQDIMKVYNQAKVENREGIVIKELNSSYEEKRSNNWNKVKFFKTTDLLLQKYTLNPAGIRAEDSFGNVVQISGEQHKPIKEKLDNGESVEAVIQYLELTDKGRLRNPSFVRAKTHKEVMNELKEEKLRGEGC